MINTHIFWKIVIANPQGLIYITYVYLWWISEWPVYTQMMVFTFTLWKSLFYVIDLNLIDAINVYYMFLYIIFVTNIACILKINR